MTKVYRLNAWFEEELNAFPHFQPSGRLQAIQAWLDKLFYLVADASDTVLTSTPLPDKLRNEWQQFGFNLANQTEISGRELVEWGKTSTVQNNKLIYDEKVIAFSRHLNSRLTQGKWKLDWNIPSAPLALLSKVNNFQDFFSLHRRAVLKPEFTTAGRGFRLLLEEKDIPLTNQNSYAVIEKWLTRKSDHSLLLNIHQGEISVLTETEMMISRVGKFNGITLLPEIRNGHITECLQTFPSIKDYTGPASIDFFIDERDHLCISEINFRYSMGRLLWQVKEKVNIAGYHKLLFSDKSPDPDDAIFKMQITPRDYKGKIYPKTGYYIISRMKRY